MMKQLAWLAMQAAIVGVPLYWWFEDRDTAET
jgi:hypothetical protein